MFQNTSAFLQVAKRRQKYLFYTSVEKCLFANIPQQNKKKEKKQNKPDYHKASMRLILQKFSCLIIKLASSQSGICLDVKEII